MNSDNLHELIGRYESSIDRIYNAEHDELFKWRAMKTWRNEWFKPEGHFSSFAERFSAAKKDFSLFMDNSRMHPSSGVLKLWEKEPERIEHLFQDVLFMDAGEDVSVVQDHMDSFLDGYEALRQKHYPGNWSFKQDRHSASVFLAMNEPEFHYVYKSSEALTMAKYIDFDYDIGAGSYFSLENYYRLCDSIVAALKEHDSLLEKHFDKLTAQCYEDRSLHLLTFDLMYCCLAYKFYSGLVAPSSTRKAAKKVSVGMPTAEELAMAGERRLARITTIEQEIEGLERECDGCEDISLIGVQVTSEKEGLGTVIEQKINKITVRFLNDQKVYILDKKYSARPRFEDDEQIIEAFTTYGRNQEQIKRLRKEIESLQESGTS